MVAPDVKPRRTFTRDEAERMLPLVRAIVRDIVVNHRALAGRLSEYEQVLEARRRGAAFPEGFDASSAEREIRQLHGEFAASVRELGSLGVVCSDPERGLVEFPAPGGRIVWKLGDERVGGN
jgi:hypothetical protein